MDFDEITQPFLALGAAYLLALPIAWNREKKSRSAGLRTFPLVAMASCAFVEVSEAMFATSPDAVARVVQGVVTGIGFIGGGAILKQGANVKGTATASALWATGAIGIAAALGSYVVAIMISLIVFLTLRVLTNYKVSE